MGRRLGGGDIGQGRMPSPRIHRPGIVLMLLALFLILEYFQPTESVVLVPPNRNLAHGRKIEASYTCGEVNGRPIKEMYCTIAGASPYTPHNQYSYRLMDDEGKYKELQQKESFLHAGQNCDYCMANSSQSHPASNMVDGSPAWYQSPPLSRGMQYREINITVDLEQEFHVAYVWIQMANSPRPGTWILEHSVDFGKTYKPWQYFASSPAECSRMFGIASLSPINEDDSVICTSEFASIHPMDNGEIMINLLEGRPGKLNFSASEKLQQFAKATNIRLRLLKPKTLQGHLMDLHGDDTLTPHSDASVTRRYFYGIKELLMGGRCVCNGHADSCDVLDVGRPRAWLCRCEHNTCGDNCERCCDGFVQKKWQRNHELEEFKCEPCNCHGHSEQCVYDEDVAGARQSLDIHGLYSGGGKCLSCQDNTEGINCNKCKPGFHRPLGKQWTDPDTCQVCVCNPEKHTGNCAEETGICECLPQFTGPNCDQCAEGYYHPPECRQCDCNVNGTAGGECLPIDGRCPCKEGFGGTYCETCSPGFTNVTAGCPSCQCDETGSMNTECNTTTGQCACKTNFGGKRCEKCANGYFNHPACDYCDCDPSGTEDDICDQGTGQCLCKPGFSGRRCEQCDENYFGYPNCKECGCNPVGSKSQTCDATNGECPCLPNFTSRTCDRCAAKYYRYPECLECGCSSAGSKGVTCDNDGQCYCKPNFEGNHCDRCMEKFYNFPICEECNCHPSGVIPEFAGCDKVAPGELCTCRENVMGRTCSQCKPTFWDLQPYHDKGCVDCNCNKTGTLALLNSCDQVTGQCACKRYVGGQKCDQCSDGFFNMLANSQIGCESCNCDVGGAIGTSCNQNNGQCRCRPRIEGMKCDHPIQDHYFPTLWHHKYEAEEGRLPDGKPLRFAIDPDEFPNFSWRGFTVFSPIQDEIVLDIDIKKSAVYKLLFHYKNPTVPVDVEVKLMPFDTKTPDFEQKAKVVLEPTPQPTNKFINSEDQPFVLNVGKWHMKIKSPKRLFLDYVVLVPSEYYLGSSLNEHIHNPCLSGQANNESCVELLYPPLPIASRVDASDPSRFHETDSKGQEGDLQHAPESSLPAHVGVAALVHTEPDRSKEIRVEVEVPEDDIYYLLVEYHNLEKVSMPVKVRIEQDDVQAAEGVLLINHCPYASFCRELLSSSGRAAMLGLNKSPPNARITFSIQPSREFSIASVNLIKEDVWVNDYLHQVAVCIRKDNKCIGQLYPQPANSILTEAEAGANVNSSISGDKLPFVVDDASNIRVMSIDNAQSTLDVEGVVASPGNYVFVVHFFSPDNMPITSAVLVQNERFADVPLYYCPSTTGCRTIVLDKHTGQKYFHIDDKYTLTFYYNNSQKGPIYIDSVIAVPFELYSDTALKPIPTDLSLEFVNICSDENFVNHPKNVSDYCKKKIFSLTSEFNTAAMPCECNPQGSLDFTCDEYGGQCKCKESVIGRTCDRCAPGFYNYPECIKCKCGPNQQCDEKSGQCFCPRYVEGQQCDRCVKYAFGYDPLIGCQLCGCNINGSHNGELECDAMSGQCLCKANVGGRRCEKCLPGYYGFPHCYECACEDKGTTDDVCNVDNAKCICKKNVVGEACDSCRAGTFDLRKSDVEGCSECFCFGVTDRCRSSKYPVQTMSFDDQSWKTDDPNGKVFGSFGRIVYTGSEEEDLLKKNVYLEAPIVTGKDYTTSYGLHLSFTISSFPSSDKPTVNNAAVARIVSADTTLEYWASEQPSNLSRPFKLVLTMFPEYWLLKSGEPASRAQLMMTLLKLEKILIKASYYEKAKKAVLEEVELEMGEDDARQDGLTASSVELCDCPPPYAGPSCQFCAPGYYRVSSGSFLGSCVPCNCHSHSGTCDSNTGLCSDCQHNTEGDHCEKCVQGFYGNATTGSPSSCLRCACPYPSEANNFALSCFVSERGILERCVCKKGWSGDRCETCDTGYYGNPLQPGGGTCQQCFCNNNNDLSEDGSCNPQTGDCALCEKDTDGRRCEYCKEWFYGDAIQSKNCTECKCDKCGSRDCDNRSGQCQCHQLVEGKDCSRCAENAWGFDSCRGCRPCNCGSAASNSQCDVKTGQCACMPGAGGQYCERCEHGYWNYSPQGCRKCDCEADLSMGTVCDVNTGQCHCQEGASGPRCDSCIATFLKIPKFGCRFCDECVFALNSEMDNFDISVEVLANTLGNVSSVALTGARLVRIQKAMSELEPALDQVISLDSEANEINDLSPRIAAVKDSSSNLAIRADRTAEQLKALNQKLDSSFDQLKLLRMDTNDLIEVANWQISKVVDLKEAFQSAVPVQNKHQIIADAERIFNEIKANDNRTDLEALSETLAEVTLTMVRIEGLKNKSQELFHLIKTERSRLQGLTNASIDFGIELHNTQNTVKQVKQMLENLSLFGLKALINGIEKDSSSREKNISSIREQLDNVTQLMTQLKDLNDTINSYVSELSELKTLISTKTDTGRRIRRDVDKEKFIQKVKDLEEESLRITGIYDSTKLESNNAVNAANIYNDVVDTLNSAKNFTQQAQIQGAVARKIVKGKNLKEKAKQSKQKSDQIYRQTQELEESAVKEMKENHAKLQQRVDLLMPQLEKTVYEYNQLNLTKADSSGELDRISEQSDSAHGNLLPLNESFAKLKPAIVDADSRVKQLIDSNVGLSQSTESARDQIQQAEKAIPEAKQAWEEVKLRLDNTSSLVEECRSKLALLKEKIAVARDKANRIKLGAHFEKGSVLELPVAQHSDDFGAYTQVRLFFRTRDDNGILLYFGNENARIAGEFIAIEIENGKPKLTLNFGRDPISVVLSEAIVNDFHWRELIVERIGKRATIKVTKPRSDDQYEDEQTVIAPDAKSVLNLFDDSRRLFVGGVPAGFKIPNSIHQHSFVGDLDKLRLNGELIGFWNSEKAVHITGADMRALLDAERNAESGVSFNGKGYMQLGVGAWNPRKKTNIMLSFFTYSPDGLLFFVGMERDQLVVELIDGRISLSFDLGSGFAKLVSNSEHYNDGKWHNVHINRVERQAKLEIDGKDVVEGESPGALFELSVSDSFYVGGLPRNIETRFSVQPFRGCIKNLKLDSEYINLSKAKATKGVQTSCLNKNVRVVSLISERSYAQFANLSVDKQIELSLRIRTTQLNAHVGTVLISDEEVVKIDVEGGWLVVRSNGEESESIRAELSTRLAGHWHYLTVLRTRKTLKLHLDDVFTDEVKAADVSDVLSSNDVVLVFGHGPSSSSESGNFVGCIGDVIYNGKLLSFAESTINEVKLTGCTIAVSGSPMVSHTSDEKGVPLSSDEQDGFKTPGTEGTGTGILPISSVSAASNVRPEGSCALPEVSHGEREDSHGIRFGLTPGSRLEFDRPPDSFDRNIVFSVQLRATAANGIIMFVTNEKHSDFMALYMQDGKIFFSFGSGNGNARLTIQGKQSLLDDEWHSVRAEREGTVAALFIDGKAEAENSTEGTDLVDAQPPLYIGGLATDLVPFSSRILPGVKSEFGGCLRDFKLNDKKFDDTGREVGTVPCAQYTENGIYFHKDGGYATISQQFVVGLSFSFELEVKPRTKNAVLLSVGVLEFLTLQILNGTVKFSVDNGAGVESVIYEPLANNLICDGHWHQIKLYKKKNLITLNVDGKSNLRIMKKKSASETSTKDPLYLGGVPKDIKLKGLDTVDPYIGCVRILSIGKKTRKRAVGPTLSNVDLSEMNLFGAVDRQSCPLN